MHYTASHAGDRWLQCIGVATSTSPAGPFVDRSAAPLVCQRELGGSIDAETLLAPGGRLYLHWKSDENALGGTSRIWAQELMSDGLTLLGRPNVLLTHDRRWEKPLIEGPHMVQAGSQHYLFYGAGWWESDKAAVGYATCSGPMGPCTKVTTKQGWLRSDTSHAGPAGPSLFQRPGGGWAVAHHGWQPGKIGYGNGGARSLWLTDVTFGAGGPVLVR
jgi:hypothetical protein